MAVRMQERRKKGTKPEIRGTHKQHTRNNKWFGRSKGDGAVSYSQVKEEDTSVGKQVQDEFTKGKKKVRNLGTETTENKRIVTGQAVRVERAKGYSTGKSKMSAKLRFKKPVGKKSNITGVVTRGKQYKTERG